jgi:thiamine biosynthesis lipoprotein
MGTVISLDVRGDTGDVGSALDAAEGQLRRADAMFSTYRPDSWISRLAAREARPADLPPEVREVLALCAEVEGLTDGLFTARWRGDGTLDPTGLVKGWAAERAGRALLEHGVADHCVNAAGDVVLSGRPSPDRHWTVGIADPRRPGALLGTVDTGARGARAVATSGIAERGRHIRDPRDGRSADCVLSATIVGSDLTLADGLATALVVAGPHAPRLLDRWRELGWAGCVLTAADELHDPDGILAPGTLSPVTRTGTQPSAGVSDAHRSLP